MAGVRTQIHKPSRKPLSIASLGALSLAMLVLGLPAFVTVAASVSTPNLAKALAAQQNLVTDRPYDAKVHNDHGNLLVLAGHYDEAAHAYQQAIDLDPASTLARYNLGVLWQQTGRIKQAQAEFQNLLKIDARHARAHYQLGMLHQARRQRSRAVESYARAFAYDPQLTFAHNNPHIIDNHLATEALLVSQRYGDAPSSEMPRLYGEPDRIVDLMLAEEESGILELDAKNQLENDGASDGGGQENASRFDAQGGDENWDPEDEPVSAQERDRRALTSDDLGTASGIGQVQSAPSRRSSSAGRDSGRTTRSPIGFGGRSRGRENTGGGAATQRRPGTDGRGREIDGRRYRRTSQYSTGRLDLLFLPTGPGAEREAATAAR